jgi:hypothetical protein
MDSNRNIVRVLFCGVDMFRFRCSTNRMDSVQHGYLGRDLQQQPGVLLQQFSVSAALSRILRKLWVMNALAIVSVSLSQGLTLVHFSAHREHFCGICRVV